MKKCVLCSKTLQHSNATGYCFNCFPSICTCKICGNKISESNYKRTRLCHSCGCKNNQISGSFCSICKTPLHTNNKSGKCSGCMHEECYCTVCGIKIGLTAYRGTKKCHKCALQAAAKRKILPEEFCVDCGEKLKTINRSKLKLCTECSSKNEFKKKNCFKSGTFSSVKNSIDIFYASSYELRVFKQFENDEQVISYNRCPYILKYTYKDKVKRYFPDLLVVYKNGQKEIIEVKPHYLLEDEINLLKFAAAEQFVKENNMKFTILTERHLEGL